MKLRGLLSLGLFFAIVLLTYGTAEAQIVDAVKKAAEVTKDATVDAAKKNRRSYRRHC